ncbi:MAG: glycosyltransferase [Bacteroidota bacterium]
MTFDITIPVLNEEATLREQIGILHTFIKEHFPVAGQWRIVIADNGSTDQTRAIATELADEYPEVKWVSVPRKGVGLALKTSWGQSRADIVGYMDLDLATDLLHFLEAYQVLANDRADLVYATRLHPKAQVIGRTLKREISSRVFNWILRFYLGTKFSDGMCGFKFLRRSILPTLMENGAENDGWFFSTELLAVAEWHNYRLFELPVKWTDDAGSSKVNIPRLARRYLASMQVLKKRKPKARISHY